MESLGDRRLHATVGGGDRVHAVAYARHKNSHQNNVRDRGSDSNKRDDRDNRENADGSRESFRHARSAQRLSHGVGVEIAGPTPQCLEHPVIVGQRNEQDAYGFTLRGARRAVLALIIHDFAGEK